MKILAVDTSTEACSAALFIDGEVLSRFELAPRTHTQLILPMVQSVLDAAGLKLQQLDSLAFGRGPGSFTGVRIATGVAQGLAYGADLPVVGISTLAAMAQAAYQDHQAEKVLAGLDARMGGVYWGQYLLADNGLMQLSGDECVAAPHQLAVPESAEWLGAGSAWAAHEAELQQHFGDKVKASYADYLPASAHICVLAEAAFKQGEAVEPALAMPVYLRNDVAKKAKDQKKNKL